LAQRGEVDVLHDHHLVVFLDEQRIVQDLVDVLAVAGCEVLHRLRHTLGRALEAFAVRILSELLEELFDELFDHAASPRYSKRFFAVSTTRTRRSVPDGSTGASTSQNARARPSPVVTTPASAGTASREW